MNTSLNTNHAWLLICAQRLLDGGRPLTDFYEPNPPLSILMYVPDVLLARLTHIPIYYTPYIFGLAAMILSGWAVFLLLEKFPELDADARLVIVGSFFIVSTAGASIMFFADRDEYVAWGLVPFMLCQLLITRDIVIKRNRLWAILTCAGICILVKPHFLLLPAALVVHRMVTRRRLFSVFRDPDILALILICAVYAGIIACLFRDYVTVIFPDFVRLYIPVQRSIIVDKKLVYGLILLAFLKWGVRPVNDNIRRSVNACIAGALLAGLLFVVQGKGNYYHEIPFLFFYFCAAALTLHDVLRTSLRSSGAGAFATFILLLIFSCLHAPVLFGFPTHADYRKLALTQIADEAGPGKTFFVVGEGMEMIHQAAIYSGHVHASRFPDLWFLTGLLYGWGKEDDNVRYANYVAADIHRYQPAIMAFLHGENYFNVVPWLSVYSPAFREEMTHYIKLGTQVDNRRNYFRGATLDYDHYVTYDIYKRAP